MSFIERLKPYGVVLNGDIVDCHELSEFAKDPQSRGDIKRDITTIGAFLKRLSKVTKERWWLCGNHEDRLRRYIWKHAEALAMLDAVSFPEVFKVQANGFKWKEKDRILRLGKLIVVHGDVALRHSGHSAKRNFEIFGSSALTGHSHRLGIYYKTNQRGVHAAYENGCLCRTSGITWAPNADWQQGFSVVHVDGSGAFHVQQIPILGRRSFYYGSERFWVKKGKG